MNGNLMETYFPENSSDGKIIAKVIDDVSHVKLTGSELENVINVMESRGMFENSDSFEKKEREKWSIKFKKWFKKSDEKCYAKWDEEYLLSVLSLGINCVSRDYFHHLAEVAAYVKDRRDLVKKLKIIVALIFACVLVVLAGLVIAMIKLFDTYGLVALGVVGLIFIVILVVVKFRRKSRK